MNALDLSLSHYVIIACLAFGIAVHDSGLKYKLSGET